MLFANLIGIVCAACIVVAPAVSEFENNAVRSVENTSFVASPKMAYYDPAGTYGTTAGQLYNYTGQTLNVGSYSYENDLGMGLQIENNQSHNAKLMAFSGNVAIPANTYNYTQFTTADITKTYDIFADGVYKRTLTLNTETYTPCYVLNVGISENENTNHYFWLFEHQEPEPPNAGVEILGDIAEGITGGIVPVAEGLGQGLQDLVSNIFLDGDGLSTFGIVAICFAGLALALGLSRWIVNFVSSLGARDR